MSVHKQDSKRGGSNQSSPAPVFSQSEEEEDELLLLTKIIATRMNSNIDQEVGEASIISKGVTEPNEAEERQLYVDQRRNFELFRNQSSLSTSTCSLDSCILKAITARSQEATQERVVADTVERIVAPSEEQRPGAFRLSPGIQLSSTEPNELPNSVATLRRKSQENSRNLEACRMVADLKDGSTSNMSTDQTEGRLAPVDSGQRVGTQASRERRFVATEGAHARIAYTLAFCFGAIAVLAIVVLLAKPTFLYGISATSSSAGFPSQDVATSAFPTREDALVAFNGSVSEEVWQDDTPQANAFKWISMDSNLEQYPLWRIHQRFAVATLYFNIVGDHSFAAHRLSGISSECNWAWVDEASSIIPSCSASSGVINRLELRRISMNNLPPEVAMMSSLQSIVVSNPRSRSSLSSFLPTELAKLSRLSSLEVSEAYSFQTGRLPTFLGSMAQMKDLELSNSRLSGSLPTELLRLTNLESLWLFDNALTGAVGEIVEMTRLTTLYLDGNKLSEALPRTPSSSLGSINLRYNQLSGTLPSEWGSQRLTNLLELRLGYNEELMGTIPEEWGNMMNLQVLDLDGLPNVVGNIPSSFCSRPSRDRLSFYVDCNNIVCCDRYEEPIDP